MNESPETLSRDINRQAGGKEVVLVLSPSRVAEQRLDLRRHLALKTGTAVGHHGQRPGIIDQRVVQKEGITPDPFGRGLDMILASHLNHQFRVDVVLIRSPY